MGRRLCAWAFIALATAHQAVWATSGGFGNGAYNIEMRQAAPSSTVPSLSFNSIDNMQTCKPATIEWAYSGPPINMTLWVTNIGVVQADSSSSPASQNLTISTRVNPTSLSFTWPSCTITSGTYQLVVSIETQKFVQMSPTFLVLPGDTSCLYGPFSTGSAAIPIATIAPVGASALPSSISTAAIVGIIIGVVAALALAAFGVYLCLRRQRTNHAITRKQEFSRGWNGANSTNSSVRTVVGNMSTDKIASRSEEKLGSMGRKDSLNSYDSHAVALANLPALHHQQSPSYPDYDANDSTFSHSTAERYVPPPASNPLGPAEKQANRASFGRKRKPAPVYDETEIPPFPSSLSSHSHTLLGTSPTTPSMMNDQFEPQSATTTGHYTTRTGTTTRPTADPSNDLLHKTSFGLEGKQLHYLMPDLPGGAAQQ